MVAETVTERPACACEGAFGVVFFTAARVAPAKVTSTVLVTAPVLKVAMDLLAQLIAEQGFLKIERAGFPNNAFDCLSERVFGYIVFHTSVL